MSHVKSSEHATIVNFIELLNEIGINVASIDNSFYAFTSFIPVDDNINETEIVGRNITLLVENEIATAASTDLRKNELIGRISEIPTRRRVFHRSISYVKYLHS